MRLNLEIASREQLEQRLRYEAFHDALTGIGNRKACFNEFDTHCDQYAWLYYFDLDNFKHANDEYGHHIGDEILSNFAKKLMSELDSEAVFRIGGDEFVAFTNLVLEDRDALRANLSSQLQQYQVGVSLGAAKTNKHLEPDKILQQADAKMYRDKSRRNK
jgi:diguanylate cyclase (GGDEF)-like protein